MKKHKIFTMLLLLCSTIASSQDWQSITIKTPTDVSVDAQRYIGEDYDQADIDYWNDFYTNGYNVIILEDASPYYNCHGYAWHNIEGNMSQSEVVNIKDRDPSHLHQVEKYYSETYSSSPAYKEVNTNNKANLKVSYYPVDHSAVTTSNANYFISKLANGPLVKHTPNGIPFSSSTQKFYDLNDVKIYASSNNTSLLCEGDLRGLMCINFKSYDFTYHWNTSSLINIVGGNGDRTVGVEGVANDGGSGTVSLTVTSPSGLTATSNIINFPWVGIPNNYNSEIEIHEYSSQGTLLCPSQNSYNLYAEITSNSMRSLIDNYDWDILNGSGISFTNGDSNNPIPIATSSSFAYARVGVKLHNTCGWSTYHYYNDFTQNYNCGSYYLLISPNPGSNETTLSVESNTEEAPVLKSGNFSDLDEKAEWDVEIYDSSQILKIRKTKIENRSVKLNTSTWKEGIYLIKAKYKNELLMGKLLVKK